MDYPADQIEDLKGYCDKLSYFEEDRLPYFRLEGLRLPPGCAPEKVVALLCPVATRDGYASRLYFSVQVKSPYARNWHIANARIGEENWVAFSWRVNLQNPTLVEILVALLTALTKP